MTSTDDDFEYHVTFPKVIDQKSDVDANITQRIRSKKEPVVFLLGWLGASDRVLSKYSNMYSDLGCITIRYTLKPVNIYITRQKSMQNIVDKLLNLAKEIGVLEHPVFFHAFSNNGAILYSYLSKCLEASKLDVKGCLFDSCPGQKRISAGVRAMYRVYQGPIIMKIIIASMTAATLFCLGLGHLFWILVSGKFHALPPWDLLEETSRWPQLVLYSKCDDLIPYQDIEQFIEERRRLEVKVCTQEFESAHCTHLRFYPEEYKRAVSEFLELCLEENDD